MDMASHPLPSGTRAYGPAQRARWTALAAEAAEANAFYAPDMLCAALDHLAGTPGVRIIEAQAGGELIGLLPVTVAARHGRLPLSCVTNWMHEHCFFGAPLIRRGAEMAAWRGLLAQLDDAHWAAGFLYLRGLDAAGANAAALEALCVEQRRGRREVHRYDRAMLRSDLDADAYWETHVRAKKRKEIRRLQKRLADVGAVEQRLLVDRAELPHWCADFLAAFDAGLLHFLRIDLDGRPIAMLANFRHGDGAFSFKIAFDEEMGRFSPGVLIELANLHAVQGDPAIGWMDSCAAPDHPMIDSLWAERRTIVQYRVALHGRGLSRVGRAASFAIANGIEAIASHMKGQG